MLIDTFNLHMLRVFEAVYRHLNMTKASEELHMTQSGVSQHIKNLEELLEITLFDRIKHKLLPTNEAHVLAKTCQTHLYGLNQGLLKVTGKDENLRGEVMLGLPLEFGNNLVVPLLAKLGRIHPELIFRIKYGHATEMNDLLLSGKIDFAFIDSFTTDRQIHTEKVREEILVLCCSMDYFNFKVENANAVKNNAKFYQTLDYVDYVEGAPILNLWFEHHLKKDINLNVRASLMDVQGMGRIICEGLGVGILPLHVVERLESLGYKFFIFNGSGKHLTNTISLAYLSQRTYTRASIVTRDYLTTHLKV